MKKSPYEQQLIREFLLSFRSHIKTQRRKHVEFTTENLNKMTDTFCARWDAKWLTNFRECKPDFNDIDEDNFFDFEKGGLLS